MPKIKAASVSVKDGNPVFSIFGPPVDNKQAVVGEHVADMTAIAEKQPALYKHCAAVGFAALAQQRYTAKQGDKRPDVVVEVNRLHELMRAGTWTPGRMAGEKQPSPLVEAMAELSGVPIHVIEERMKDKSIFSKSKVAELRYDPTIAAKVAEINKKRAEAQAAAAKAAGKGQAKRVDLGSLFGQAA
jgi:hypothetical protein